MEIILYANTGIQLVESPFIIDQQALTNSQLATKGWLNWSEKKWAKYRVGNNGKILIAIDTSLNLDCETQIVSDIGKLPSSEEPTATLSIAELGVTIATPGGNTNDENLEIFIRRDDAATGPVKDVTFVLDYGNNRTSGLLVENDSVQQGQDSRLPAVPFELIPFTKNFSNVDSSESLLSGEVLFSSRMGCINNNIPRTCFEQVVNADDEWIETERRRGLFGKPEIIRVPNPNRQPASVTTTLSKTFTDISPVRLGADTDNITSGVDYGSNSYNVQISSPKRYLWSEDEEESYWYSLDPLKGSYKELDTEFSQYLGDDNLPQASKFSKSTMMIPVMYELIVNAYRQINSIKYRTERQEVLRKRRLKDIIVTYPSVFTKKEISMYKEKILQAIDIFCRANNIGEDEQPNLIMDLDEGTSGQLAYIYGEIRDFPSAERWLELYGKNRNNRESVRIATIDIGGGTSDLSISEYQDDLPGAGTQLTCKLLYADGTNTAGDDLVEAICSDIVIPELITQLLGNNKEAADRIFLESTNEMDHNRKMILAPFLKSIAYKILSEQNNLYEKGSLTINMDDSFFEMRRTATEIGKLFGLGNDIIESNLSITVSEKDMKMCVKNIFRNTFAFFADQVMRWDCDIVTLAGKPSSLKPIENYIRGMLPISDSRIIPMELYKTGRWYPLQDENFPGLIKDAKSVVVVGAAIHQLARRANVLDNIRIEANANVNARRFHYWAQIGEGIRLNFENNDAFFTPDSLHDATYDMRVAGRMMFIGRRSDEKSNNPAIPTYQLQSINCMPGINCSVKLKLIKQEADGDALTIKEVNGTVILDSNNEEIEATIDHFKLSPRSMIAHEHFVDSGFVRNYTAS